VPKQPAHIAAGSAALPHREANSSEKRTSRIADGISPTIPAAGKHRAIGQPGACNGASVQPVASGSCLDCDGRSILLAIYPRSPLVASRASLAREILSTPFDILEAARSAVNSTPNASVFIPPPNVNRPMLPHVRQTEIEIEIEMEQGQEWGGGERERERERDRETHRDILSD